MADSRFVRFESTIWSLIRQAREDSTRLGELLEKYRVPLRAYLRSRGLGREDAEDLVQEVFTEVCGDRLLDRVEPERGRFRTMLLAVTRHVLASWVRKTTAEKRGGGLQRGELRDDVAEQPEADFNRFWVEDLARRALARLGQESREGRNEYHPALMAIVQDRLSYEEAGNRLGKTPSEIRNVVYRARTRLKRYVLDEIARYSSTEEEFQDECRQFLPPALDGRAPA